MQPLRIGLLGLGYWGKNYLRIISELPTTKLAAICDTDSRRLEYWCAQYPDAQPCIDPRALLRQPLDAVIIATPVATHYALAKAALEAGFPVLVEKPLVQTSRQAEELAVLAESMRLPLLVDHTYLFAKPIAYLKECLRNNTLGQLHYITSRRLNLGAIRSDCNVLWDLAVHDVAILLYLLAEEPSKVTSACVSRHPDGHVDYAILHLEYEKGYAATIHVCWFWPEKVRELTLVGSHLAAQFRELCSEKPITLYRWQPIVSPDSPLPCFRPCDYVTYTPYISTSEPLRTVVEHFIACIRGSEKPLSDAWFASNVIRILEAAHPNVNPSGRILYVHATDQADQPLLLPTRSIR